MSNYILTYTEYTLSRGYENFFFIFDNLKEAEYKALILRTDRHHYFLNVQIWGTSEMPIGDYKI